MITDIFDMLSSLLSGNFGAAVLGAFFWGVLSIILSPCHLSSIPLIIGYLNKHQIQSSKSAFYNSLIFSLGILVTIAVIGAVTFSLGGIMGDTGVAGNYTVAAVFFAAGLYLLDIFKFDSISAVSIQKVKPKGYFSAFLIGLLFGFGLGPCTFAFMAPVLGAAFHYSALNFPGAVILLAAFALGHCFVIAGAGTLSAKLINYLNWSQNSKIINILKKTCGVLVILGGVYFIYLTF